MLLLAPGDYGKSPSGEWLARPPDPEVHTGSLKNHEVVEHEDGTITVRPSILIQGDINGTPVVWHGYLENGIWREV